MSDEHDERLERLLGYRRADPANRNLTVECAEAALAADRPDLAFEVLGELSKVKDLDDGAANLAGIAAMRMGNQQEAQARFRSLLESHPEDPSLLFNLAWSMALDGDKEGAIDALDEPTIAALPQAAMLDLQLRHEAGQWDEAAERMQEYLERFADYAPLQAAASVLAMDLDDASLARACALRAADHPDAMTTLGILELGDNRPEEAAAHFRLSLEVKQANPRARIGLGLVELGQGRSREAAGHLDAGASEFGDHLGSWIAAGWAWALAGDLVEARRRFKTALATDDTFAEAHGSLAALDVMEGEIDSARRRMAVALRLDRNCFSAALTGVLLASAGGDAARARTIFEAALGQPVLPDGATLGEAIARLAL